MPRLLLVALFALAACRVEESVEAPPRPPAPATDTVAVEPETPPAPVEQAVMPLVALDADGLRLVDPESGRTRPIAFGDSMETVVDQIVALRGPAERSRNEECGAGPLDFASWPDGLRLAFQDGLFAGWAVHGRQPGVEVFTTLAGLGVRSPRSVLDSAYVATVEETSLGTEFAAAGLYGILDSDRPDARVEAMWAGVSCNFR